MKTIVGDTHSIIKEVRKQRNTSKIIHVNLENDKKTFQQSAQKNMKSKSIIMDMSEYFQYLKLRIFRPN